MAVVTFNPAAFKTAFPEFATVPDARLQLLFNLAGSSILDNSDASIIVDPAQRAPLLDLLVAHLLTLFGTGGTAAGGAGTGARGVVGRVASATEGSVSTSLAYSIPAGAGEAWFQQTQYGAMYWMATAPWRSFRYVETGRSGVGHALDYYQAARGLFVASAP